MITQPFLVGTLKGIVEALTEFLPVSSTGHLILMNSVMGLSGPDFPTSADGKVSFMDFFDIFIQFGAILAVIVEYRTSLWRRLKLALGSEAAVTASSPGTGAAADTQGIVSVAQARRFWLSLMVGTVPILIVGFVCKHWLDGISSNQYILLILASAWIVGGAVMWANEIWAPQETRNSAWDIDLKTAATIGLIQCVALWPGISRSAATIITGRRFGMSKQAAAEFSFFLAVPALTAASAYKLMKYYSLLNAHNLVVLLIGTGISFVGAWLVIRLFLAFLRKFSYVSFAVYRILLGLAVLGLYLGGWHGAPAEPAGAPIAPASISPAVPSAPAAPAAPGPAH